MQFCQYLMHSLVQLVGCLRNTYCCAEIWATMTNKLNHYPSLLSHSVALNIKSPYFFGGWRFSIERIYQSLYCAIFIIAYLQYARAGYFLGLEMLLFNQIMSQFMCTDNSTKPHTIQTLNWMIAPFHQCKPSSSSGLVPVRSWFILITQYLSVQNVP